MTGAAPGGGQGGWGNDLVDAAWAMLNGALGLYRDNPRTAHWLRDQLARFDEPLRVTVAGLPGSGKSTLVNAIVGEEVAPIRTADGDAVTGWYSNGAEPRATAFSPQGPLGELPVARRDKRLHISPPSRDAAPVSRLVVDWPARALRDFTLVDPPGSEVADEDGVRQVTAEADAVIYLMRRMHRTDLRLLRAVQDGPLARSTRVNTILVLCRADEVGAGRVDALSSAKQVARRLRRDPAVRGLCQNVIAVAGLVAQAGRTLREAEFAALSALAGRPRDELDRVLLSTDRFTAAELRLPVGPDVRRALLDRFGLFGVRLATTLIRTGCDTHPKLAGQLVQRSGLSELRESIASYFTDRHEVLKARSALIALGSVVRADSRPEAGRLAADAERALCGAHDFRELRLLAALQVGRTRLPEGLDEEAGRLVGAEGVSPAARLGFGEGATEPELRAALLDALRRWQEVAADPLLNHDQRYAARIVVRTCEGMLAAPQRY
ncbi:GTPase domain-containing protein [Gandjariella thermophila]|uniref:GTPase n=1 Tax=Gandjariella thermophila TaxID=1931992 RepID=A0A4D4J7K9_9PSEU|nr:GTPase domain-containing protein [Gandjariella thermophila]GDY31182.1 GTPase [Gandjariella thermophila]